MKNIRNMKNFTGGLIVAALVVLAIGCSYIGGFTRGKAASAIEQDSGYSAPATMTINIGARLTNAMSRVWQTSNDDTAEAAAVRAKADFMLRHPQIILAEHLGYIKLYFENPRLGRPEFASNQPRELSRQGLGVWDFDARAEITDKGKELWRDLGLKENSESLPLAVRRTPDITGLADEAQTMKRADFTYKWKPTELGKAFEADSSAFGKLPPELQEALKKTQRDTFGGGRNNIMNFSTPGTGIAHFKKFDDGWRLNNLYLM